MDTRPRTRTGATVMKNIARITFTVDVSVPDNYSEEAVASYVSCLRHYDLKGCLYEGVVFGALSAKPNQPRDFDADVSVSLKAAKQHRGRPVFAAV